MILPCPVHHDDNGVYFFTQTLYLQNIFVSKTAKMEKVCDREKEMQLREVPVVYN